MASRAFNAREASTRSSSPVLPFFLPVPSRQEACRSHRLCLNATRVGSRSALVASHYFFGQGTLMLTVEVSPLRYLSSVFAGKPPFGHFFGTVP